jgi:hypothetical protein
MSLARSLPRTCAPHTLQVRLESEIIAEEMMDQHRAKKECRFNLRPQGPREAADAGENIVELLLI